MNNIQILIIDDEDGIKEVLSEILTDEGYQVYTASDDITGLALLNTYACDIVILDVFLPNRSGLEILQDIRTHHPDIEVLIISGHASIDVAIQAVKYGAYDLQEKPLSTDKLLMQIRNMVQLRLLKQENLQLKTNQNSHLLLEKSSYLKNILEIIHQSADSMANIFIFGENGTGKEVIAHHIHSISSRNNEPFITVNCVAIPDHLIESELFGHEKNAFPGAVSTKKGKFELAHNGTLFLDEIAELSLSIQAKILHSLQNNLITRIGAEYPIAIDIRIICATNKNMTTEITNGNFREDLFYRLHVIPLTLPPLRKRLLDIPLLGKLFLHYYCQQYTPNGAIKSLSQEAINILQNYSWPGNIRQFKNIIERISIMNDDISVSAEAVEQALQGERAITENIAVATTAPYNMEDLYNLSFAEAKTIFERNYFTHALNKYKWNISKTAQSLNIYPSALHAKIKKLSLEKNHN